ncbi:unnamed protein product [Arctogadus glacialis]
MKRSVHCESLIPDPPRCGGLLWLVCVQLDHAWWSSPCPTPGHHQRVGLPPVSLACGETNYVVEPGERESGLASASWPTSTSATLTLEIAPTAAGLATTGNPRGRHPDGAGHIASAVPWVLRGADQDGNLLPGDRLMCVNDSDLSGLRPPGLRRATSSVTSYRPRPQSAVASHCRYGGKDRISNT